MSTLFKQLEDVNIIAWILENRIKNERGRPITFDNHAFMVEPYLDWTPEQGTAKSSQCGWSVMTNIKLMWAARYGIPGYDIPGGANVIYTLPSDSDVNAFVPSKTNALISQNPAIQAFLRDEHGAKVDADSIQRKKLRDAMIYFKGTISKTAAIMLTSDLNIHDEADRSDAFRIDEYASRVSASVYKGKWVFSNPSYPGMPADALWTISNQKHWFITCEHCGYKQFMDWHRLDEHEFTRGTNHTFIDVVNGVYVCGKCQGVITDDNRRRGEWIKKFRDKPVSGYWVNQLMYPWVKCAEILHADNTKPKQVFLNMYLGKPYVGSDVVVDRQVIVQNMVLGTKPEWHYGEVAMGVDNGNVKHYVIGTKDGIFAHGKTEDWGDIEKLIQIYQPTTVIDLNPYPATPRALAAKYRPIGDKRWRVYCNFYTETTDNYELIEWQPNKQTHMVHSVRNPLFDQLIGFMAEGGLKFYGSVSAYEEYISHWESMYRADMIGSKMAEQVGMQLPGQVQRGVWLSNNKVDHFCHATLYFYIALQRIQGGQGIVIARPQNQVVKEVARELGGVQTVPSLVEDEVTQLPQVEPVRPIIKTATQAKPKRMTGGSTSGRM